MAVNRMRASVLLTVLVLFPFAFAGAQKINTLEDCINYAIENNLDVKKQILSLESTKASLLQSKLNLLLNLNTNGTNT